MSDHNIIGTLEHLVFMMERDRITIIECEDFEGELTIPEEIPCDDGRTRIVKEIGDCAFMECTGITSITIPDSVESIGEGAFRDCLNLVSINIPDGTSRIGGWAFYGCRMLPSLKIPDSVTAIEDGTFAGCYALASITLPDTLISIGEDAFNGCSGLTSMDIPEGVRSIGNTAFARCRNLESIRIPKTVESIGVGAFNLCPKLRDVNIDADNQRYSSSDDMFMDKDRKTLYKFLINDVIDLDIPHGIVHIDKYTFLDCKDLRSVTLPNSVTSIEDCTIQEHFQPKSMNTPDGIGYVRENTQT